MSAASTARAEALRETMAAENVEGLLVFGNAWHADHLRYATDFPIQEGQGLALLRQDGSVTLLLDDAGEAARAGADVPDVEVRFEPHLVAAARALVERAGNQRVAMSPKVLMPYGLAKDAEALRLTDGSRLLGRLLMTKFEREIETVRRAAEVADEGYRVFREAARPGRKDYELIAEVEAFFRTRGVTDNFMIIGVGGVEVRGMTPPSGKVLKAGDLVITELTPAVDGYYAQVCRTLVLGEPNEDQRRSFAVFSESLEAGLAAVRAGVTAGDVARAENDVFRRYDLGSYVTSEYTRVRGHGLGLFPDTQPHILEDVDIELVDGMTVIVHPNTYNPWAGYMVLGDSIVVRPGGYEALTKTPRTLFTV